MNKKDITIIPKTKYKPIGEKVKTIQEE